MIRDEQIPEISSYRDYEKRIVIEQAASLADSVVFRYNDSIPVHNWFRFKEGFSSDLLNQLLSVFKYPINSELTILDPYCGVGTGLLSAQSLINYKIHAIGIERNPFIAFVANTKLNWHRMEVNTISVEGSHALKMSTLSHSLPELSSIREGRCITRHMAGRILDIHDSLDAGSRNYPFLRLGIASAIEPLSRIRRDGRALRIVAKPYQRANDTLTAIWEKMRQDVLLMKASPFQVRNKHKIFVGDGRDPQLCGISPSSVDLLLTSPPYPNNIDYSEVYKLELWLLGFINSAEEFLQLRYSTFRSHPTFDRDASISSEFKNELERGRLRDLLGNLVSRIKQTEYEWRARLLEAYFADCWEALKNYRTILRPGGRAVFVVGNSLHGTEVPALVATDLILARIGECLGYHVEKVAIARSLKRRLAGNHFLRESLVVLRRDHAK